MNKDNNGKEPIKESEATDTYGGSDELLTAADTTDRKSGRQFTDRDLNEVLDKPTVASDDSSGGSKSKNKEEKQQPLDSSGTKEKVDPAAVASDLGSKTTLSKPPTDSDRAKGPFREESLSGKDSSKKSQRDLYLARYANDMALDSDVPAEHDTVIASETTRDARPRFPSLETGPYSEIQRVTSEQQKRAESTPPPGRRQHVSTAHEFHPTRHRRSSTSVQITYRSALSQNQRRDLIRRIQKTKSEARIVRDASMVMSGGVEVYHSRSRQSIQSQRERKLSFKSQVRSKRDLVPKYSEMSLQTGVSAGWHSMGMFGIGMDIPLQLSKPTVRRMKRRLNLHRRGTDSETTQIQTPHYVSGTRRTLHRGQKGYHITRYRPQTDDHGLYSAGQRSSMVSTYYPITIDESTQERERMYRRRVTGGATTAAATEEGESPESLDFVHSWSEADSQELPTPSQKPLTAVPEDMEVYYSETDQDALEEEEEKKLSCEQIRYLIGIFFIRFLHTGFLDLDLVTFVREMSLDGYDGLWFISLRFAASFVTSAVLICWMCKCLGSRVLHVRSWLCVFVVTIFSTFGMFWKYCDTYGAKVQLYVFLVLIKGVFYCEGGAICALITCVVFPPTKYHLVRAIDLFGVIFGDLLLGCLCSQLYQSLRLVYTSMAFGILGAVFTIILAFILPFKREDAIAIISARQGIIKDKFNDFGRLLKVPQVTIACLQYIPLNMILFAGGLVYNTLFIEKYGLDTGGMAFTVYFGVSSACAAALSLGLGFITDPGRKKSYVICWACSGLMPVISILMEPPEGINLVFSDIVWVKVTGLVFQAMLTVPFRVFSMCLMRYYVIPELITNVVLLINLSDMLGRCISPIVLQALSSNLHASWTMLSVCLLHFLFIIIDVIIVTVDNKKEERLAKQFEATEAQTLLQDYAGQFEDEFDHELADEIAKELDEKSYLKAGNADLMETEYHETPLEAIDEEKESEIAQQNSSKPKISKS